MLLRLQRSRVDHSRLPTRMSFIGALDADYFRNSGDQLRLLLWRYATLPFIAARLTRALLHGLSLNLNTWSV